MFCQEVALTLSQTSPGFLVSGVLVVLKTLREKEKLLKMSSFSISHCVSIHLENFQPFASCLKLLSAISLILDRDSR